MTQSHLNLLLDANIPPVVAEIIANKSARKLKVRTLKQCNIPPYTEDSDLVVRSCHRNLVIVTCDYRTMNEHRFLPCTHGGIIVIRNNEPTPDEVAQCLIGLCRSGSRLRTIGHVTHLWFDKGKIFTHKGEETIALR